jgi:chromosome transmission fidelity protein 1
VLDEHGNDITEFLVDPDATSAPGTTGSKRTSTESGYVSSSSEEEDASLAAQDAADAGTAAGTAAAAAAERRRPQLIFCSRTHSQLSQFVGELHRTRFADSVMLVAVGSRKNLCVNDEVGWVWPAGSTRGMHHGTRPPPNHAGLLHIRVCHTTSYYVCQCSTSSGGTFTCFTK